MDDLNEKITALLSDPAALENIRNMASGLLGSVPEKREPEPDAEQSLMSNIDIGKIMSVMSRLNNSKNDDRSRLLLALKPHLSAKRQERVDKAVKILKLLDMLPLLQDSGFLGF